MKLYPIGSYFTTEEFRCPCGCGFGDKEEHIDVRLTDKVNMMRILYGKPLVVTSGARCKTYNEEVGGATDSAHLPHYHTGQCRAVDLLVNASDQRSQLIQIAVALGFERIGLASNFLHFDVAWDLPKPVMFNY